MSRDAVLTWLKDHPAAVHGDPDELVARFEQEVRRHAEADAWRAARAHVADRMHEWEEQWGYHSSEAYAAKEVCPELAQELQRMEPHFEQGDEPHLVGEELLGTLEPEARRLVEDWVREVANDVEHKIWEGIVDHTREQGRDLARTGRVSSDTSFEHTAAFGQQAARIAKILLDELDAHLSPKS
jgi:hypothetical protein